MEISTKQVCEDLMCIAWHVKSTMFHIAEMHNLTPVQLFALYAIMQGGNTMGRVAETLHCDASNVTGVVDRLVAQALVVRAESEHDRRTKTLALTDKGQQLVQGIINSLPERLGCSRLDSTQRRCLHSALQMMSKAVS